MQPVLWALCPPLHVSCHSHKQPLDGDKRPRYGCSALSLLPQETSATWEQIKDRWNAMQMGPSLHGLPRSCDSCAIQTQGGTHTTRWSVHQRQGPEHVAQIHRGCYLVCWLWQVISVASRDRWYIAADRANDHRSALFGRWSSLLMMIENTSMTLLIPLGH